MDTQAKTIFHQHSTSFNTLALWCKIMQHNSGGTVQYWQQIQFQILVHLLKGTSRFFGGDGVRSYHHADLENQ